MRIVSPFKDYYDCIQQYGQDDLLYVRRKEVVKYRDNSYSLARWGNYWPFGFPNASAVTIGFAGKVYYALTWGWGSGLTICHSPDDVAAEIAKLPKRLRTAYDKRPGRVPSKWNPSPQEYVERFFHPERPLRVDDLFEKSPVWVGREHGWHDASVTFNDCLRPLDFARVLPPYTAFQELFTFLSNQAKPFRPIPHVDDKTLAEAKGFDKHSFRKQKASRQ